MAYRVEVWHDTTMWNEQFHLAHEPYAVADVDTSSTAEKVATAVLAGRTLPEVGIMNSDKAFKVRIYAVTTSAVIPERDAIDAISSRLSEWDGL